MLSRLRKACPDSVDRRHYGRMHGGRHLLVARLSERKEALVGLVCRLVVTELRLMQSPRLFHWSLARVLALAQNPAAPPSAYERQLLTSYQRGTLTLPQVVDLLEASPYQLLYHSCATPLPSLSQLRDILDYSRTYNATHQITGLLLSSEGHFVQLLEGPEAEVHALYTRIKHDQRHQNVQLVGQGAAQQRYFTPWHMGFAYVAAAELTRLVAARVAGDPGQRCWFDNVHVQALWHAVNPTPNA